MCKKNPAHAIGLTCSYAIWPDRVNNVWIVALWMVRRYNP